MYFDVFDRYMFKIGHILGTFIGVIGDTKKGSQLVDYVSYFRIMSFCHFGLLPSLLKNRTQGISNQTLIQVIRFDPLFQVSHMGVF